MEAPQCSKVDAGLKSFKLLSRRLHTLLNTHATELQILQRLYYKNKNQHRGSLFWRKVVEIKRYSERFEQHKLHLLIDKFRYTFYGPGVDNTNSLKGPWTHFPDANYISSTSKKIQNSVHLLEKTCQSCLKAYMSFHCSMQSAAFLPLFLMFIAISSRMRVLCSELQDVLQQAISNMEGLLPTVMHAIVPDMPEQRDATVVLESDLLSISIHGQHGQHYTPSLSSHPMDQQAHIIVERKIRRDKHLDPSHPEPARKRKRNIARNDIDDIFGS